jgi:hypothetical protein
MPQDPSERSLAPTTTSEDDLRTAGQRTVNLIWEFTQAGIAISVVLATVISAFVPWMTKDSSLLTSAFFLVIGFYFGRTNHSRMGDRSARNGPLDDR